MRCICCHVQPFQSGWNGFGRVAVDFFSMLFDEQRKIQQPVRYLRPSDANAIRSWTAALGTPPRERVGVHLQQPRRVVLGNAIVGGNLELAITRGATELGE